jgi:poly [ADP-ribose] polymerase
MATKVKAWTYGQAGMPFFPTEFEIVRKAVLQVTDIKNNNNKYYALELHKAEAKGTVYYRLFTHYGRTDDLETNPEAGQKECRFFADLGEAQRNYDTIYREKTSPRKGYKEVSLASTKIGSQKARGTSTGQVDDKTLAKLKTADGKLKPPAAKASQLPAPVQELVRYLYDEATTALTSAVSAKITAHGIETPLGILTVGQIEKGEEILSSLYDQFKKKKKNRTVMEQLSGEFYTVIPHRIGRTRAAIANAVIDSLELFEQKQEMLQLMKDMLQVNGESGSVLFDARVDQEYEALKCQIEPIDKKDPKYRELEEYVVKSQVSSRSVKVHNLFQVRRDGEWGAFAANLGNERLLFHGSRIQNWVGILSRGILLPKIVVSLGVDRTDAGWLGNGIYFGDAACTSAAYTTPGKKKTRFMTVARVALGNMKDFTAITYGLSAPPKGYDSCHGVRCTEECDSEFDDDEFVVYTTAQQRLEYLVEMTA